MDAAAAALFMLMAILPPQYAAKPQTAEVLRDVLRQAGCEAPALSMRSIAKGRAVEVVVHCPQPKQEPVTP